MAIVRVIFANLQAKPHRGDDAHDMTRLLVTGCDIFGACEVGGRIRALFLKRRLAKAGLSSWASIPTPLAWPKTWDVIAKGKTHLSDRTDVGPAGPGPARLRKKDAPWVLLHEPMGDLHYVTVAHLAPTPGLNEDRAKLHALQVDRLAAALVQARRDNPAVIRHAIGDWNTPDRDRLAPITDAGLDLGAVTPDLHGHQLSYVGSDLLGDRGMIRGLRTDHNAVTANLKHKGAPVPTPTPTPAPPATDKVTFRTKLMDNQTMYGLMSAEAILGYELTVTQGCYSTAVGASAGTHAGGGVVDLAPFDQANKVRVLRDLGWAIWHRPAIAGLWPEHIHGVMIGHPTLSPEAAAQVGDYRAGGDGLKRRNPAIPNPDPNPYRPSPEVVYDYHKGYRDSLIRGRNATLKARIKTLRDRISANRNRITYK